jgi:hypothetical protein
MKIEEVNSKRRVKKRKIFIVFRVIELYELKESSRTKLSKLRFSIDASVKYHV